MASRLRKRQNTSPKPKLTGIIYRENEALGSTVEPADGKRFTRAELCALLGCEDVQRVRCAADHVIMCDESGRWPGREPHPSSLGLYAPGVCGAFIHCPAELV